MPSSRRKPYTIDGIKQIPAAIPARGKYVRVCEDCGELFETDSHAVLCDECRRRHGADWHESHLPSEQPSRMLDDALRYGAHIADTIDVREDENDEPRDY